ncbi:hypothetical protein ACLOJK_031831 [Asimina triloba]
MMGFLLEQTMAYSNPVIRNAIMTAELVGTGEAKYLCVWLSRIELVVLFQKTTSVSLVVQHLLATFWILMRVIWEDCLDSCIEIRSKVKESAYNAIRMVYPEGQGAPGISIVIQNVCRQFGMALLNPKFRLALFLLLCSHTEGMRVPVASRNLTRCCAAMRILMECRNSLEILAIDPTVCRPPRPASCS